MTDIDDAVKRLREWERDTRLIPDEVEAIRAVLDALDEAQAAGRLVIQQRDAEQERADASEAERIGYAADVVEQATRAESAEAERDALRKLLATRVEASRLDAANAKLARIAERHQMGVGVRFDQEGEMEGEFEHCIECGDDWPCETARILNDDDKENDR